MIVDVPADPLGLQGRMVNLVARADLRREPWGALQRVGVNDTKTDLPSKREHGGHLFLAAADKPGGDRRSGRGGPAGRTSARARSTPRVAPRRIGRFRAVGNAG